MAKSSELSGFYKLSAGERLKKVKEFSGLNDEECKLLAGEGLKLDEACRMIENVIGTIEIPLGIATNFRINGKDYLIPMAIEEPSVVAAASNAAKMARVKGGFKTGSTEPVMIGQVQIAGLEDAFAAKKTIDSHKKSLVKMANEQDPTLVKYGGGAKEMETRVIDTIKGKMLIVHLLVDCRDAMGANAVNTMAEALAPIMEELTGGEVYLRIISNLAVHRLARAEAVFAKEALGGEQAVEAILNAYAFALADSYRAATHNKGIMNGITAMVLATGNDTRAVEAGAHAYASMTAGRYVPLTSWEKNGDGDLVGRIEIPLAVGLVGGATKTHPVARTSVKILGVKTARELAEIMAAVGLAQNLAALKALVTEGIQRGHMELHARNVAVMAGAKGKEIDRVAEQLVKEGKVKFTRAQELVKSP